MEENKTTQETKGYEEWKDVEKDYRWKQLKAKAKSAVLYVRDRIVDVANWCEENPKAATMIAAAGTVVISSLSKSQRNIRERRERYEADMQFYDRSSGRYIRFKRRPTDWEMREASRRHDMYGEPYNSIYRSMGLI